MIDIRTVRMIRKIRNVLQVQGCSWWLYLQQIPMYHIFLETSGQIQLNGGDTRYLDCHQVSQDDQEDQECPPSTRMFLMAFFATNTHVSYIYGNLRSNPVDWWWHQVSWPPSDNATGNLAMLLPVWQCCWLSGNVAAYLAMWLAIWGIFDPSSQKQSC